MNQNKLHIIVAGFIVGGPLGGLVWHHLQYVLGFHQMGHHVIFVEDSDDYPSCYNPQTNELSTDPSYGLAFINQVFSQYGLQQQWAYFHYHSNSWFGISQQKLEAFANKADIFINLSGVNPLRDIFSNIPVRIFIDTDPVFTQVRHLTEPATLQKAMRHNYYFTYGENIGNPDCNIPNDGLEWKATRQPVFLNAWQYTIGNNNARWTTVMQWDSYKVGTYNAQSFGMKSASFDDYFLLPEICDDVFELAVGGAATPKEKLSSYGWNLCDPLSVTLNTATYQRHIQQSKGEWSIAKHGYTAGRSGWFSERSTGYLASGRPVVVQDTGFSNSIETGRGLFSFTSPETSVAAIEEVNRDYALHCRYARDIAEEYFRFDKILHHLLEHCNIPAFNL